jgi:hypothetical protein
MEIVAKLDAQARLVTVFALFDVAADASPPAKIGNEEIAIAIPVQERRDFSDDEMSP